MAGLLTPEQEAQFKQALQQQGGRPDDETGGEGGALPPDAQQEAMQQGAQMAQADMEAGTPPGADAPGQPAPPPGADPSAQALSELGFGSVDELVQAYKASSASGEQMRDTLTKLTALGKAQENEDDLDPNAPDYATRKAIRDELSPLYDKMRDDARNKLVQDAWGQSVIDMPDFEEHKPDILAYMQADPELAVSKDGLRRAYEGARSKKYKSESQLLADPEAIKRLASNDAVKKAVMEAHLAEIARNGDAVPASVGEGGGTPLTGKKKPPSGMEQARSALMSMLGSEK